MPCSHLQQADPVLYRERKEELSTYFVDVVQAVVETRLRNSHGTVTPDMIDDQAVEVLKIVTRHGHVIPWPPDHTTAAIVNQIINDYLP